MRIIGKTKPSTTLFWRKSEKNHSTEQNKASPVKINTNQNRNKQTPVLITPFINPVESVKRLITREMPTELH
ncbi:hypothetical protein PRUB_a3632 [Pseudoalteromonas rubra]|uniref:Uncharacterized protein n=1 Tax=Pseudoalteromonas rubra TaxID=43658 RepID=A0A8T0C8C5_9GAMM|nr:hypothetical protein PRUB_a3632 [Pseudoalteromonas rubra]